MFKSQRRLSQNFLHNRQLVTDLVRKSSIGPQDTVLEIGPGFGLITQVLLERAHTVLAVEYDPRLVASLINQVKSVGLVLFNEDFLDFPLPHTAYKVFANPPFAIEGKIIRKLLNAANPPEEICLVLRKEPAMRWSGYHPSMFARQYEPWFTFEIMHHFKSNDFRPSTKVPAVLLRIIKRKNPLLKLIHKEHYQQYVSEGFSGKIKTTNKPTALSLAKWIKMYQSATQSVHSQHKF